MNINEYKEKIAVFFLSKIKYPILTHCRKYNIMENLQTIDYLIRNKQSVSRFGDGELQMIKEKASIGFQESNTDLAQRLQKVLESDDDRLLVCLPHSYVSTKGMTKRASAYCRCSFVKISGGGWLDDHLKRNEYGSSEFTRFYIDYKDKRTETIEPRVNAIKKIWEKREVYLVEGSMTFFGVGNDLLNNVGSIHRIICPATNAFSVYDRILSRCITLIPKNPNVLVLIALGPSATVLAYDLSKYGYWAVDIGHADIEYEWFLQKSVRKEAIAGKSVNESNALVPKEKINDASYTNSVLEIIE